jgi:hypothetical protein
MWGDVGGGSRPPVGSIVAPSLLGAEPDQLERILSASIRLTEQNAQLTVFRPESLAALFAEELVSGTKVVMAKKKARERDLSADPA